MIATVSAGNGLERRPARVPADAARHGADHGLPRGPVRPLPVRRPGQRPGLRRRRPGDRRRDRPSALEWHSLDHVPLTDSYIPVPTDPSNAVGLLPHQRGQPGHGRQPADRRPWRLDRLQGRPPDRRHHLAARRQGVATSSSAPASSSTVSTTRCRRPARPTPDPDLRQRQRRRAGDRQTVAGHRRQGRHGRAHRDPGRLGRAPGRGDRQLAGQLAAPRPTAISSSAGAVSAASPSSTLPGTCCGTVRCRPATTATGATDPPGSGSR